MERTDAINEVKRRWKEFYPAAKKKDQIICPLCGHGVHGDGITRNPKAADPYSLKCFGCDFAGDILSLLQADRKCDFNAALQYAAGELGITIDRYNPATAATAKADKRGPVPAEPPAEVIDYSSYYETAAGQIEDPAAAAYLASRGISLETARAHGVGYDPAWISPAAVRAQIEKGDSWRPPKTRRVIIPVTRNHYIARAIDQTGEYAKMNETGRGEAGIFNVEAVKLPGPIFVCEGVFDALAVLEAGHAAIALNSVAMTDKFLDLVRDLKAEGPFILALDNDTAGAGAMEKIRAGLQLYGVPFTENNIAGQYKDPSDALTADREGFFLQANLAAAEAQEAAEHAHKPVIMSFLDKVQTEAYKPYETGLSFFDDLLGGGVIRQTLLVLMAAPAAGKTTLCQQLAEAMASRGNPVLYLNFEMSREQMIAKGISARTQRLKDGGYDRGYDALQILQGYKWTEKQREQILAIADEYAQTVLSHMQYNPDEVGSNLEALREYLQRIGEAARSAGEEAPALIVDYLHLITSASNRDIKEIIKDAITMLKEYAIRYNTFVIAISAPNRASNTSGKYTQASARDSSNIEYTADYMLSLSYYENETGESDSDDMDRLNLAAWRRMILKVNKSRFTAGGKSANVYFYPRGNCFYGEYDEMPADPERVPFDSDPAPQTPGTTRKRF